MLLSNPLRLALSLQVMPPITKFRSFLCSCFPHNHDVFDMNVAIFGYNISCYFVSWLDAIQRLVIGNRIRHGHGSHETRYVFAVYDHALLLTVNRDNCAFKVIPP